MDSFNQLAFKASMQQSVYRMLHAGHYLSTKTRADAALGKLAKGEFTRAEVANELLLRKYDVPVIDEFFRRIDNGELDEAARFLAIQTGQDMVGVYGLANHPVGWNTNTGRIFGQFGQWSVWFRNTLARELTRGNVSDRVGSAARFAGSQALILGAGSAMGLDLMRWMPLTGLAFFGGPMTEAASSVADLFSGNEYVQSQAIKTLMAMAPLFVPGSFAARDIFQGLELLSEGDPRGVAKAVGVPVKRDQ
jgi:hypothetical protein